MATKSEAMVGSARRADGTSQRDVPTGKIIRAFTVRDILDEEIGRKLA